MDECRRSGQIPAFGNWDYANELPITQYFESARQAGLIRYCSSSGDLQAAAGAGGGDDLYDAVDFNKRHLRTVVVPSRKTRGRKPQVTEQKKQLVVVNNNNNKNKGNGGDVKEAQKNQSLSESQKKHFPKHTHKEPTTVKAIDEDLYKIPPELLHTSKRNKMLGFFSRCLVPACKV